MSKAASKPSWEEYKKENDINILKEKYGQQLEQMKFRFKDVDDIILYRFLKAFEFDVKAASENLELSLKWKIDNNFKELSEKAQEMSESEYPHANVIARFRYEREDFCMSKSGCPVSFMKISRLNPVSFMGNISQDMLSEYYLCLFAKKFEMYHQLSKESNCIIRGIRIFDLEGLGMQHLSREMQAYLKSVLGPANKYFPEHLYKAFIINAPSVFSVGWSLIKGFLPERTIKKVEVLGKDYKDRLLQFISEEELPIIYGGKNPNVVIPDLEEEYTKAIVGARKTLDIDVLIEKENEVVYWDFRTTSADIKFQVTFHPEGTESNPIQVIETTRVESFKKVIKGHYHPNRPGRLLIQFDNSYSMLKSKELIYLIEKREA